MAEYVNNSIATVASNQSVPLDATAVSGKACIVHREGSGQITLRGLTNQNRALFRVSFGGNIAIPTGGTVEAITAARRAPQGARGLKRSRILIAVSLHKKEVSANRQRLPFIFLFY